MPSPFTKCPSCRASLPVEGDAAYCNACDLHLVGVSRRGRRFAAYALSIPERMSRMLVGSAAGLLKGLSEFILPDAVRKTKLYHVLLQKNLRYLIQEVGAVEGVYPKASASPQNFVARKFVGNFIELTGFLTLHASPVWILALVSDISGGTKVFLDELAGQLKREGLLDPGSQVETVDQLLDGLQFFAGQVADRLDTPPLSVDELRESLRYLRQEARAMKLSRALPPEAAQSLLNEMLEAASKENKSLFEISAAMAMSAVNQLERSGRRAVTGLRVARALLDSSILQYYSGALKDLTRLGYYRYLARASKPYLRAIGRHLTWRNITWTERYFLSRTWDRIVPFKE